jgi:hypothetical protein
VSKIKVLVNAAVVVSLDAEAGAAMTVSNRARVRTEVHPGGELVEMPDTRAMMYATLACQPVGSSTAFSMLPPWHER